MRPRLKWPVLVAGWCELSRLPLPALLILLLVLLMCPLALPVPAVCMGVELVEGSAAARVLCVLGSGSRCTPATTPPLLLWVAVKGSELLLLGLDCTVLCCGLTAELLLPA